MQFNIQKSTQYKNKNNIQENQNRDNKHKFDQIQLFQPSLMTCMTSDLYDGVSLDGAAQAGVVVQRGDGVHGAGVGPRGRVGAVRGLPETPQAAQAARAAERDVQALLAGHVVGLLARAQRWRRRGRWGGGRHVVVGGGREGGRVLVHRELAGGAGHPAAPSPTPSALGGAADGRLAGGGRGGDAPGRRGAAGAIWALGSLPADDNDTTQTHNGATDATLRPGGAVSDGLPILRSGAGRGDGALDSLLGVLKVKVKVNYVIIP